MFVLKSIHFYALIFKQILVLNVNYLILLVFYVGMFNIAFEVSQNHLHGLRFDLFLFVFIKIPVV